LGKAYTYLRWLTKKCKHWLLTTAPECAKPASLVMMHPERCFRLLLVALVIRE